MIEVITNEISIGTADDLLKEDIDPEKRLIIEIVDKTMEPLKKYLSENGLPADEFLSLSLKIMANIFTNIMLPFLMTMEEEVRELIIMQTISALSEMNYKALKEMTSISSDENKLIN